MSIDQARSDILQARARTEQALGHTPDERLNWSPSPSARTPIQLVVHIADSVGHMHGFLTGRPFEPPTSGEADAGFRRLESAPWTREEALALLDEKVASFIKWLDDATTQDLEFFATMPFGMGQIRVADALRFVSQHTNEHAAQLEYLQTCWGDRDWHAGF